MAAGARPALTERRVRAEAIHLNQLEPTALDEADLLESVAQLGRLHEAKEVTLVRLVTEVEARGVASPGGLRGSTGCAGSTRP